MLEGGITLVEVILVLLALSASASSRVDFVTNAAHEVTTGLLLLIRRRLVLLLAATAEILDKIHLSRSMSKP